jgi:regulator of sigma E protease
MTEILIKIAQLLLSLSILVVLHELGHYIPAKIFKTRVEKFYLFFDPWFSIFKKKIGDTEYGIGWLPLGGYVKISGMIDESMDTEQMKKPAQPWEFRSKPAWQRLIIMIGGVTVNVVLAFVIYSMMLFAWGKEYIPNDNLVYGVYADSLMLENGFEHGDRIVSVGGQKPATLSEVNQLIIVGGLREVQVLRNGSQTTINLPADIEQDILRKGTAAGAMFLERYPAQVDTVMGGSEAEKAGLRKGDKFVSINREPAAYFQDLVASLRKNSGRSIDLEVEREGEVIALQAKVTEDGKLGFGNKSPLEYIETEKRTYGFIESIPAGISEGTGILVNYVRSLKLLFSSEGAKQVGGFITIGGLFDSQWNWVRFWNMTALLSIILAVMNILPIPALDGGHVMFLLYEMIAGKEPNPKFMEYAQLAGLAILVTLLLYANGMDVFRWWSAP